jgi:hypothetical protein
MATARIRDKPPLVLLVYRKKNKYQINSVRCHEQLAWLKDFEDISQMLLES